MSRLSAQDPALGRLISRVGPFGLEPPAKASVFAAVTRSIAYQQLTGKAAATIFGRMEALYGGARAFTPDAVLATPDLALRQAGLSGAKVAAVKDLAAKCADGTVPDWRGLRRLDDEAVVERLTRVRGVGRWTAEMILIFRLGRPDVLPLGDYGVRKGFALTFRTRGLPTAPQL
ncbi:MAG TPA: DNA-3-methyladenine glycosylase 2 family protein, partial [Myxococcaceae bacterium]|nr:DNA-3-methyladenine glycosylase 2 family protein [Myxococcaceae bacterium]